MFLISGLIFDLQGVEFWNSTLLYVSEYKGSNIKLIIGQKGKESMYMFSIASSQQDVDT